MNRINKILETLERSDRVKIFLPSGAYIQGKKRKIQREINQYPSELEVYKTETGFVPVPFLINLKKEVVIYLR